MYRVARNFCWNDFRIFDKQLYLAINRVREFFQENVFL